MKVKTQTKSVEMLTVAETIRAEIAAGDGHYREVGRLFAEQKAKLGHGQWLPWLKAEGFKPRQAQRYMEYAKCGVNVAFTEICNPETSRKVPDANHRIRPTKPTLEEEALQETSERSEEQQQERLGELLHLDEQPLARELVNIGFRRLAALLHPDKGGTNEAMIRLSNVRGKLTDLIEEEWA